MLFLISNMYFTLYLFGIQLENKIIMVCNWYLIENFKYNNICFYTLSNWKKMKYNHCKNFHAFCAFLGELYCFCCKLEKKRR